MRKIAETLKILDVFAGYNPKPKTELYYTNDFTLLVAILLSAQSTDKGVNRATPELFKVADTPQKMLALGLVKLKSYIKTVGLYNKKAEHLMVLCNSLIEKFDGKVPQTFKELESLSGVGRKTANVFLCDFYGLPTIGVDTHVLRVSRRLNLTNGRTPLQIENDFMKVLPDKYKVHLNHWLVLFGRYICRAKNPDCKNCPVANFCKAADKKI